MLNDLTYEASSTSNASPPLIATQSLEPGRSTVISPETESCQT